MDYLDEKERERRRKMEEKCAKLRIEVALEQNEERGRRMQEEQRKMQEEQVRMQKIKAKLEKEKNLYYVKLQNRFKEVGANMKWEKEDDEYIITIVVREEFEFDKLFAIIKKEKNAYYKECHIKDTVGKNLVKVGIHEEVQWDVYFYEYNKWEYYSKGDFEKQAKSILCSYLGNRKIKRLEESLNSIIKSGTNQIDKLSIKGNTIEEKTCYALKSSNYDIDFQKEIECIKNNDMLIVDYGLPNMSNISDIKEYKYIASKKEINIKKHTNSYITKRYEYVLYSITLRSLYEIFYIDSENEINGVTFNGFVTQVNPATGITERKCILSIQVDKEKFSQLNLSQVEPKACFKALKGVSAAKLVDISPITPILTFNKKDRRFVEGKDVEVNQGTNLAAMHWEDFEHLVRELFEMEFARNGGEVRVTQASRDGGVDAIVFDPDPLRGGKIVIQAKRYTNTVGVSAVRDLYGTVINEGANSGILITTSDYGHDSYEFAKDKPLKLLNGGHLLALLHKNGRTAHINIEEAKKINEENRNS